MASDVLIRSRLFWQENFSATFSATFPCIKLTVFC
jgi:hypothetical protein